MQSARRIPFKTRQIHTSVLLQQLLDGMEGDNFTLEWLIGHLPKHSFGVILLFLSIISLVPFVSIVAQALICLLALQIIAGYEKPVLPRRWMQRELPTRYFERLDRFAIPAFRQLERFVQPRLDGVLALRRFTAFVAFIFTASSLLAPLPMINIPPAIIDGLMALAYIEHDGLLLGLTLVLSLLLLGLFIWIIG